MTWNFKIKEKIQYSYFKEASNLIAFGPTLIEQTISIDFIEPKQVQVIKSFYVLCIMNFPNLWVFGFLRGFSCFFSSDFYKYLCKFLDLSRFMRIFLSVLLDFRCFKVFPRTLPRFSHFLGPTSLTSEFFPVTIFRVSIPPR